MFQDKGTHALCDIIINVTRMLVKSHNQFHCSLLFGNRAFSGSWLDQVSFHSPLSHGLARHVKGHPQYHALTESKSSKSLSGS